MKTVDKKDIDLISSEMTYAGDPVDDTSWVVVDDEDTYLVAKTFKDLFSGRITEIEEYFKPRKQRASAVHKDWVAAENEAKKPYITEKGSLQGKMNAYLAKKEKARLAAVEKVKVAAGPDVEVFIPPAEKQKGVRHTITGEVTDLNAFLEWAIKDKTVVSYVDLKQSPLNFLAKTLQNTKREIPGFKVNEIVTAI